MPAHIPAAVGRGALPLVDKINNRQSVQIGPSYYRPTYTAASQCIGVLGQTRPLAEKMTTSELSNQLTPEAGPQKKKKKRIPTHIPAPADERGRSL